MLNGRKRLVGFRCVRANGRCLDERCAGTSPQEHVTESVSRGYRRLRSFYVLDLIFLLKKELTAKRPDFMQFEQLTTQYLAVCWTPNNTLYASKRLDFSLSS